MSTPELAVTDKACTYSAEHIAHLYRVQLESELVAKDAKIADLVAVIRSQRRELNFGAVLVVTWCALAVLDWWQR